MVKHNLFMTLTCQFQLNGDNAWEKDMVKVLKTFLELLKDDKTVSSYELQTSGVVRALLHCLSQVRNYNLYYPLTENSRGYSGRWKLFKGGGEGWLKLFIGYSSVEGTSHP